MKGILATREEIVQAVNGYNALYRDMDEALWCVSRSVRDCLRRGQACQGLEVLVWTVKSWWGGQGVKTETRVIAAGAPATLGWTDAMFGEEPIDDRTEFAADRVAALVGRMKNLGANRTEFPLAAKSLHWLMPWRIPVYDSFVRKSLGISGGTSPQSAYLEIVEWELEIADSLMDRDSDWLGTINPRSALRTLDKYLWWKGGGHTGKAVRVRDPWRICRTLGLNCR